MTGVDIPHPGGPDINIGHHFLKVSWTLYGAAIIILAGRLYAQVRITRTLGVGDFVMVGALLFGIAASASLTESYKWGFGRHFFYLNEEERAHAQFYIYINEPLGIASSSLGRLSFMLLLWRLFATTKVRCWTIIFLAAETIIINLVTAITIFTQCKDTRTLWNPIDYPSKCWSPVVQEYTGYFQGSCNSATDLALTIFPLFMFWNLNMTRKIKFGLAALLGMSIFAFVASVVKVTLISSLSKRSDYTFNTVSFFIWTNVENALVIISASIPLLRPIFMKAVHTKQSRTVYHMTNYCSGGSGSKGHKISSRVRRASSVEHILPPGYEEAHTHPGINFGLTITKQVDVYVEYEDERGTQIAPRPLDFASAKANMRGIGLPC